MKYEIYPPVKNLEHIVKQYVVIHSLKDIEKLLFLPNGGNFIVFNRGMKGCSKLYSGETFDIPKTYSVGIKTNKVKKAILSSDTNLKSLCFPLILVELLPIGFYKLFHEDASLLNDGYMEIEDKIVEIYFKELYQHERVDEEITYLNDSLSKLEVSRGNKRLCIEDLLDKMIYEHRYEVQVKDLVEEFGCSRSTLERQFKKYIGLTPKNFILVSKFTQTLLSYIEGDRTLKDLDYIYSDNSHMNRVFKNILGIVPSEIFHEVSDENLHIYQRSTI